VWQRVEEEARRVLAAYNFREIRTPVLEPTELFARSVGSDTDIVTKEMYTFQVQPGFGVSHGEESLTLRPEATASVVRAYIEHSLYNEGGVQKLYYLGPMFRRERPQKGRYRQFYQIGAEVLGSESPAVDVEVLEMLFAYLGRLGIEDFRLLLNSVGCGKCRPEYIKVLRRALEDVKAQMCADCQRRADTNPLRVFDCKVEADQPIIAKLPAILDHLCLECRQHFSSVTQGLEQRGLPYEVNPRLVRGLDYYTRTTFEVTSGALGAQNSVLGGGRYDGLSELIGGPPTPGFGFAIGEDRLVLAVEQVQAASANGQARHQTVPGQVVEVYIIWMDHDTLKPAAELARSLRREGRRVELPYDLTKLKKAMGIANKLNARFAVIIGEQELASARYQVKDMSTGQQEEVEADRIAGYLTDRLAGGAEGTAARQSDLSNQNR
jgi:histidyl-tRNA synthetase